MSAIKDSGSRKGTLPNWHGVNVAQGFREPATYFMYNGDKQMRQASYDAFNEMRKRYGKMPGGMYAADMPLELNVERRAWPADDFPFTADKCPLVFTARGVKIPSWGYDATGMTDELPDRFAPRDSRVETIRLIPMGAARLRISAFPTVR